VKSRADSSLVRDLAGVAVLAALCLAIGLVLNRFRATPVALAYHSPAKRLEAQLTKLVNQPLLPVSAIDTIGLDQFRAVVEKKSALVLDARSAVFYRRGHVPSALNLARDDFAHDYKTLLPTLRAAKEKPIVVYCSGGECPDSKLVAAALMSLGYGKVSVFAGGWHDWTEAGLAVERSDRRPGSP
jgi:rhodanese-related sulfurtransferase